MAKRRKRRGGHAEGHENAERWLLTYADMITLLVAFFVMMYSMSVLNLSKFKQVAISIKSGFGGPMDGGGNTILNPGSGAGTKPAILPEVSAFQMPQVAKQMRRYIEEKHLSKELRLKETERGLVVTMVTDKMLFPKGKANMTPQASEVLDKVAHLVRKSNSHLRVEGHTDNLPIRTEQYPSNWELSTARAATVVRYLVEHVKFDPRRLSAMGYADSRPLVPNTSEANRAFNRRVDLVIVKSGME